MDILLTIDQNNACFLQQWTKCFNKLTTVNIFKLSVLAFMATHCWPKVTAREICSVYDGMFVAVSVVLQHHATIQTRQILWRHFRRLLAETTAWQFTGTYKICRYVHWRSAGLGVWNEVWDCGTEEGHRSSSHYGSLGESLPEIFWKLTLKTYVHVVNIMVCT